MWRVTAFFLLVQVALVLSEPLDDVALPAAEGDDECLVAGEGTCALNALQRRGAKLSSEAPEADQEEDEEDEELQLLEGEDLEDEDPETETVEAESTSGASKLPDMSGKDEAQMLRRLKKHTHKIAGLQKKMDAVEKKVNETYVMTMQELSGRANATVQPPPMKSTKAAKGHKRHASVGGRRRRRHHTAVKLPPKMKKVEMKVQKCEKAMKKILSQVKRSSDILVFTRKRIQGGEIALAQEDEGEDEALGADADPEEDGEEEPLESADAELHVQMSREDLDLQVKQFNTEIYDINNVIKDLGKREAETRKLFMDTFRVQ